MLSCMADGWERRQERTRQGVLDAAGVLIAESGLDGLTMRKLATRAGVAVATLYNQFGDRSGVLVAFVSSGLDRLEVEFDAQPAREPIETTRALFEAFDAEFAGQPEVWRPIFSTMRSGPGSHGMGPVGDRVTHFIEQDFAKAAANGMLVIGADVETLAQHVFTTRMNRLEKWASGIIEWAQYRTSSILGLELTLAAVLADPQARQAALDASGITTRH